MNIGDYVESRWDSSYRGIVEKITKTGIWVRWEYVNGKGKFKSLKRLQPSDLKVIKAATT